MTLSLLSTASAQTVSFDTLSCQCMLERDPLPADTFYLIQKDYEEIFLAAPGSKREDWVFLASDHYLYECAIRQQEITGSGSAEWILSLTHNINHSYGGEWGGGFSEDKTYTLVVDPDSGKVILNLPVFFEFTYSETAPGLADSSTDEDEEIQTGSCKYSYELELETGSYHYRRNHIQSEGDFYPCEPEGEEGFFRWAGSAWVRSD